MGRGATARWKRDHRVIAVDLLGHGGSEKPGSGYTPPNQAKLVAEALEKLHVRDAEVVGHSLGGAVSVALAEQAPSLVNRVAIIDMPPDNSYGDLGFIAGLAFQPILGEALWTIKPDFSDQGRPQGRLRARLRRARRLRRRRQAADLHRLRRIAQRTSTTSSANESLDRRMRATGKPLMVLMGAEEQIVNDPQRALGQYANGDPGAETHLIAGAGHSPNVEKPAETARLILKFAKSRPQGLGSSSRDATERGAKPQRSS